jgi:hypothetical protein
LLGENLSKTVEVLETFQELAEKRSIPYRPKMVLALTDALLKGDDDKLKKLVPAEIASFIIGADAGLIEDRKPITLSDLFRCVELERLTDEMKLGNPDESTVEFWEILLREELGILAMLCQDPEVARRRFKNV